MPLILDAAVAALAHHGDQVVTWGLNGLAALVEASRRRVDVLVV